MRKLIEGSPLFQMYANWKAASTEQRPARVDVTTLSITAIGHLFENASDAQTYKLLLEKQGYRPHEEYSEGKVRVRPQTQEEEKLLGDFFNRRLIGQQTFITQLEALHKRILAGELDDAPLFKQVRPTLPTVK